MSFKNVIQLLAFASLTYVGSVQAIVIGSDSSAIDVELGDEVTLGISFDFDTDTEVSVGGSFRLTYDDTLLINPLFNFSPVLIDYGIDTTSFDNSVNGQLDISFGTFNFFGPGVSGAGLLGQLTFNAISEGGTLLFLEDINGGFSDFNTFEPQVVDYQNTRVNVVSSVPLPASVWLFISSLGFLAVRRKV